jgi:hypothetical protein
MAVAIFTPDRVEVLVDELRDHEHDLKDAGEKSAAKAIAYVRNPLAVTQNPGENLFVQALCQLSIGDAMQAAQDGTSRHRPHAEPGRACSPRLPDAG